MPRLSVRPLTAGAATPALIILLLCGLGLRLAIAYVFFPSSGFSSDISTYASWALTLVNHGPGGFYANAGFVDYPPAYLYVLWPLGLIAQTLSNASGGDVVGTVESLLKLPPILIDMAVGYVLYRLVSGWARPGRHAERLGLVAAALYVFNPVTFYDSALWGQTDAVGALVLLLGVAALIRGNSEGATALAVLAALVKPQYGVVLLPLVGVVLLKRHLFAPGSGPRNSPRGPRRLAAWLSREQGPVRLLTSFVVAWAVFFPVALPFAMGPYEYLKVMAGSAGGYSFLSVNAYNLWALIGSGGNPSLAGSGMWSPDTGPFLGPLSAVLIGSVLLVLGFLLGLARVFWRDDRRSIVLAAAFLCLCFFILPTRVHERYLFPVFAFLPILAVGNRRWLVALVALAVGSFMNLHAILTNLNPIYGTPNVQDLALGDTFRTFPFVALSVALQTAGFVVAAWQLRPGAAGARDAIDASAAEPAVDRVRSRLGRGTAAGARPVGPRPGGVGIADGASAAEGGVVATEAGVIYGRASATVISGRAVHLDAGGGADPYRGAGAGADGSGRGGAGTDAGMDAEPPPDAGTDWGSYERPRYWDWLKSRITAVPLRRDRSGELAGESTGRWDRLDLLLLALIVIGSFTLRAWHLGMPYGMYFDEVYHARTATEFLQDWQYGMPHGIYEYTHPHLAKYSMALSIQQFADNKVTGVANLNTGVEDAAVEVRWSPDTAPNERDGDRLYVADGTEVQVYDLTTRDPVTAIPVTADALAVDPNSHMLYVASAQGVISSFDTTQLDALRRDPGATVDAGTQLTTLTKLNGSVQRLEVVEGTVIALTDEGEVRAVDEGTGDATGTVTLPGAAALTGLPDTSQVVADPTAVTNPAAEAKVLGDALKEDAGLIEPLLRGHLRVSLAGYLSTTTTKSVQSHIDDGSLPGITIQSQAALGVADTAGLTVLDASSLARLDELTFGRGTGLTLVSSGLDHPTLYVAAGRSLRTVVVDSIGPLQSAQVPMPGPVTDVLWNQPANLIHAVGTAPDGSPTIYVVEPHANAVYADAKLPFTPIVTVADTQPDRPEDDRMQIIAFSQDGQLATVDIGGNAFAWRLPGVIMGTLTAACLYLLMRLLFRRRSVAVIAAVLVLVDGMFFANSRIAMNDSYTTGFIVAAVTLFAPLYLGIWRRRWQVAAGLMGVGLLLGLALASKWVGAYAMGGLALLLLLRSALGRMIALAALIGMAGVLGELGIRPADIQDPHRNWFFLGLMVVMSIALAVAMVRRPVRFTMDELRFAVVGPALLGALLVVAGLAFGSHLPATGTVTGTRLELAGAGLLILGAAAYALAWLAGHFGLGPLAAPRPAAPGDPRAAPAPTGWLRPGWFGGIPWIYALGCIAIVPLIVYVASYIPWALNGTGSSGPVLFPAGTPIIGLWPPGHAGQTFLDLQVSMYKYHNELRATHAASSPWWAWPMDLKPVWFYQQGFANNTTGVIYDSGNLVVFWLSIGAIGWATFVAWRRRSLSLTLIVLLFFCMWLPWMRIDRATFQYHVLSNLPFAVLALAYLLAELWHGPPPGAWLLARIAAALAILGPPLLWVVREPLCSLAGTALVHPDGIACGPITRTTNVSEAAFVSVLVLLVAFSVLAWQLWAAARSGGRGTEIVLPGGRHFAVSSQAALFTTLVVTLLAIVVVVNVFSQDAAFTLSIGADEIAVVGLLVLAVPAWMVLRARDSRRFVLGVLAASVVWFVAWYPNLTGLPMPNSIANIFQGLLPTWNYDFQFTVNTDPPVVGPITNLTTWVIVGITTLAVIAAMLIARAWRGTSVAAPEGPVSETA